MKFGSACSGIEAASVAWHPLGWQAAWFAEIEPFPCAVLAHHYPDAPNLGDMTRINWSSVDPVDILTGGFPCQDVSHAGRRAGMIRDGDGKTRSGLWGDMRQAIDTLRPSLVVVENVRGLLSATVDSDVEPCPWCLGDGGGEPHLRALGAVLADLADVGYDAWWTGLRASGVGAPHGRFRVFIFATPKDADRTTRGEWRAPASREETQGGGTVRRWKTKWHTFSRPQEHRMGRRAGRTSGDRRATSCSLRRCTTCCRHRERRTHMVPEFTDREEWI